MIVSHKYKFIFLHSRRTAGNSFSLYFNQFAGESDVIIESWSGILQGGGKVNREALRRVCRNFGKPRFTATLLYDLLIHRKMSLGHLLTRSNRFSYYGRNKLGPNPAHASAWMVRNLFPDEYKSYFKFAFFRNPYEYVVSDYNKKINRFESTQVSFDEYLEVMADPDLFAPGIRPTPRTNIDIYTFSKNALAVDFLGDFSNLTQDIEHVCNHVGLPFCKNSFPHLQKTKSIDTYTFTELQQTLIERAFHDELKFLRENGNLS